MPTRKNDSLKGSGRQTYQSPLPRGNFRESDIQGQCLYIVSDEDPIGYMGFTQPAPPGGFFIEIVFFLQDAPTSWFFVTRYGPSDNPDVTQSSWPEAVAGIMPCWNVALLQTYFGVDPIIVNPVEEQLGVGEQAQGMTVTNGVPVSGYYFYGTLDYRGIQKDAALIKPSLDFRIASQSKITYGPPYPSVQGPDHARLITGLLRESDYTQEIKDAGNVFELPSIFPGAVDLIQVVGVVRELDTN